MPLDRPFVATVRAGRLRPDVVIEDRIDGVTPRLACGLHRGHARERLRPGAGEDDAVVMHLIAAVPRLPHVAELHVLVPGRVGRTGRRRAALRIPGVRSGTVVPVADDRDEIRGTVAHRGTLGAIGQHGQREVAIEQVPGRRRHRRGGVEVPRGGERRDDLVPDAGGDLVGRTVTGCLRSTALVDDERARRVEVADVDGQHRHEAVSIERRPALPETVLADRREAPRRSRVVDVPAHELELGVEVELDAGERLEAVPGLPAHLVQRERVAPPGGPVLPRLQRAAGRRQ